MMPSEHLDYGIRILSQLAFCSDFNEEEVKIEKDIIIEEIKQYANEPEASFIDHIQNDYFKKSPLKNPILGTVNSIRSADFQGLRRFYKEKYRPDNAILVITGNYEPNNLQKSVKDLFGKWQNGRSVKKKFSTLISPEFNGFRFTRKISRKNGEFLAFALPELSERNELNTALLIIVRAFASGKQSSLYKRLVENDKTALEIRLHSISGLMNGITVVQVFPANPDSVTDIIYAFNDEWQKVSHDFFKADDLQLLIKEMNYAWLYDFEYIESLASALGNEEIIYSYRELYDFPKKLALVDSQQLRKCLDLYWKSGFISIYYQGRYRLSDAIVKNINKLFATNETENIYTFPESINRNIIKELIPFDKTHKNKGSKLQEFKQVRLDCGMNLVMRRVVNKPTVGLSLSSPLSQLCETKDRRGLNYFTSALLLFGTKGKTYDEIQKVCLNNGFSLKTSQSVETTSLRGKCLSFSLHKMLGLISEISQSPAFPPHYLSFIRSTVAESIRREKASPFSHAFDNWTNFFIGKQNNLNKPYGSISEIKKIRLEQLMEWYNENYHLDNFILSLAGDIDYNEVEDTCNKLFHSKQNKAGIPIPAYFYETPTLNLQVKKVSADQSNIFVGGFGTSMNEMEENAALYALSQIIGGDLSSRFFSVLREKHGFAYQTGFDVVSTREMGYWFGYVTCDKSDYKTAWQKMLDILSDTRNKGVTDDELVSARNYMLGMHRQDMESVSWQASSIAGLYALGYDYGYFTDREKRISTINHDMINQVARRCFNPDNLYSYIER
jgi:zinc protease